MTLQQEKEYYFLKYIENTGQQQWIDTGYYATANSEIIITVKNLDPKGAYLYFGDKTSASQHCTITTNKFDEGNIVYAVFGNTVLNTGISSLDGVFNEHKINKTGYFLNGVFISSWSGNVLSKTAGTLFLFTRNIGGKPEQDRWRKIAISEFIIKENGVIVMHLKPIIGTDGIPCMYDLISEKKFYNKGEGSFIAGPKA